MRIWGRITNPDGSRIWQAVTEDAAGNQDMLRVTQLCQVLLLSLGESPFFGNYGIPVQRTLLTQIFPDFYVQQAQRQFAGYFAALTVSKVANTTQPTYNVNITTHAGTKVGGTVSIPT